MKAKVLEIIINKVRLSAIISSKKIKDGYYQFELKGKSRNWSVVLAFSDSFPFKLPSALLLNKDVIGKIPHVNILGLICVEESDTVILDHTKPSQVIEYYLNEVLKLLERATLKIFQDELLDEIEGYFSLDNSINSFYKAEDKLELITMRATKIKAKPSTFFKPLLIHAYDNPPPQKFSNVKTLSAVPQLNVLHLPLEFAVLPPDNGEYITPKYIEQIKGIISQNSRRDLRKLIAKKQQSRQFFILLSMPRTSGERSQLLLEFQANKKLNHPLIEFSDEWKIQVYSITRCNQSYLLERGGANENLSHKRVAIAGCGSLGGEVAIMLAKSGIGELTLIDNDHMSPDNIYRHTLGGSFINFSPNNLGETSSYRKVNALAESLVNSIPYLKVNTKFNRLESLLGDKDIINSDLIVVAVGEPSSNLIINRLLKQFKKHQVIFCWNEAGGLGGHSIILNLEESCLECIYSDRSGFKFDTQLNLLQIGQPVSKNLTGCAGVFTPFSYIDSSQTASLVARQCLDFFKNNSYGKALSWKGSNYYELKVTDRFISMPLKEEVLLQKSDYCEVCSG